MRNTALFLLLLVPLLPVASRAQGVAYISFEKSADTIQRRTEDFIYTFKLGIDSLKMADSLLDKYKVSVFVVDQSTSLAKQEYSLHTQEVTIRGLKNGLQSFFTLKSDTLPDRDRVVVFGIKIVNAEGRDTSINVAQNNTTFKLTIGSATAVRDYDFLGYLGTNFDLVDGVKPKDLFFAVNLFTAPVKHRGFGYNFSLYGNRTLSLVDSTAEAEYTSRVVGLGGDSSLFIKEKGIRKTSRVSDNLGASFSPLIRLWHLSDEDRVVRLFWAPHTEFIWRRITVSTEYSEIVTTDSTVKHDRPITGTIYLTDPVSKQNFNAYDVYLSLAGFYLVHEDKRISVRFQAAIGYNMRYTANGSINGSTVKFSKTENTYVLVRTWITEPLSGITLGAEAYNNIFKNHQPNFNVTLSKAFHLDKLAGIFSPVTSR